MTQILKKNRIYQLYLTQGPILMQQSLPAAVRAGDVQPSVSILRIARACSHCWLM